MVENVQKLLLLDKQSKAVVAETSLASCSRKSSSRGSFLSMVLRDPGGASVNAVFWDFDERNSDHKALISSAGKTITDVEGKLSEYNGSPQFVVSSWGLVKDPEWIRDLQEEGEDSILYLVKTVKKEVKNKILKNAALRILDDERLQKCPAGPLGSGVHDCYLYGLPRHMANMMKLALTAADSCGANREVIVAGIIFHDCGKRSSYTADYTEKSLFGRLLDHPDLGLIWFENNVRELRDDDPVLYAEVAHIILSHHGEYSAVKPQTLEAIIVASADSMDSRVAQTAQEKLRANFDDRGWTEWSKILGGRLFDRQQSSNSQGGK